MAQLPYTQLSFETLFSAEGILKMGALVNTPKGEIEGLLLDIPSRSFQNNWSGSDLLDMADGLAGKLGGDLWDAGKYVYNIGKQLNREFGSGANADVKVRDTVQYYQGPINDRLSLSLLLMKEFQGGKYASGIKAAVQMTHPEEFKTSVGIIQPPSNYNPASYFSSDPVSLDLDQVCQIRIREHEELKGYLMDSCSITSSAGVREDGEPIYRIVNMEFSSLRALDGNEVTEQFLNL